MTATCTPIDSAVMGHQVVPRRNVLAPVALKITRRRFAYAALHEIQMYERIWEAGHSGHENLTNLVDFSSHEGYVCLAFELHGRDLSHTIRRGKLPVAEVKVITRQLLCALQAMHEAGVIHADVKPGNILYDRKKKVARLSDLGLSEISLKTGEPLTTQDYAPPEALFGSPMAAPVDIWALGCTVFEMLTGELLFNPWNACVAKYSEFGSSEVEETEAGGDCIGPSRAELDRAEEKREQLSAGTIVSGKYELLRKLGEGKFATVWKAVPLHDRRTVMPPFQQVLDEARARRAELPPIPPRARWNLYEVAEAYEHLVQMHELLGHAPAEVMQGCWSKLFCEGEDERRLRFAPEIKSRPLSARLGDHLPEDEAQAATIFLEGLLRYMPNERLSAQGSLKLDWVKPVAA